MKILIVGAGPKGLQALGQLVAQANGRTDLQVGVVDPTPPGTGAGYDPRQPDFLRLNVSPRIVHQPPLPRLVEWAGLETTDAVPRALVGRYLAEAWERLRTEAPFPIIWHRASVVRLGPSGDGWRASLSSGDLLEADEVLLATGHAPDWDGALVHGWSSEVPLIPSVYPVEQLSSIQPGARVATRGAALTFIDLALALTEGRDRADWPAAILPTARTGQLLGAKPAPLDDPAAVELPRNPLAVLDAVEHLALDLLNRVTGRSHRPDEIARTLATGWEPDLGRGQAAEALRRSVQVADGSREPGPAWALGRTWSVRYAEVVQALSFSDPDPDDWSAFLHGAAALERLTFGPPLGNARRLLALIDEGVVDTSWLDRGVRIDAAGIHQVPAGDAPADWVVDAVLAPPGADHARTPLVDQLLAEGHARLAPGQRGLAVDREGRLGRGLSSLGRPVEDVVVGNDTLSGELHDLPARWAGRVLGH